MFGLFKGKLLINRLKRDAEFWEWLCGEWDKEYRNKKTECEQLQSKCERLNNEVIGVMKENDRLKKQLEDLGSLTGLNDGGGDYSPF